MLRTVIIDDEPLAIDLLKGYVTQLPSLKLTAWFTNPLEAFEYLRSNETDLVILDIEMPNLRGLDLVRSLKQCPKVIFISAHKEFAIDAFEVAASDYLLKPVTFTRFLQSVARIAGEGSPALQKEYSDVLYFKVDKKVVRLYMEDIFYFESCKDYMKVHSRSGSFITYQNLAGIEAFLPGHQFIRIHKSYMINILQVEYIEGNTVKVGNALLPVGKNFRVQLLERIHNGNQYASRSKFA